MQQKNSEDYLELVQMSIKNETTQCFIIQNVKDRTITPLTNDLLKGHSSTNFCKIKENTYFIYGGFKDNKLTDLAFIVDIKNQKVTETSRFPFKISHSTSYKFEDRVYCFGGITEGEIVPWPCYYKIGKETYEPLQMIPYKYKEIVAVFGYENLIVLVLSESRFVCFEPKTGEWFFWKKIQYEFDFVCSFEEDVFLCNTQQKTICKFDIKKDLIQIQTMIDQETNELIFSPSINRLYVLQHLEDPPYYYEVDLKSWEFTKFEGEKYTAFFNDGVLFRNEANFAVYQPKENSRMKVCSEDKKPEKINKNLGNKESNEFGIASIFGCFEVPFQIDVNVEDEVFTVNPVSSNLILRNSQGVLKLAEQEFLFAGGKKGETAELGEVDVQRYSVSVKKPTNLKELPQETEGGSLVQIKNEIFFLNESIYIFLYDLKNNKWSKMRPNTQELFYNSFVFQSRLFLFMSKIKKDKSVDFVLEEYNVVTDSWSSHSVKNVDYKVQAQFSFQTHENKFLMICTEADKQSKLKVPQLYQIEINEKETSDKNHDQFLMNSITFKVSKVLTLTDKLVPSFEIVSLAYKNCLLFCLVDNYLEAFSVIYDFENQKIVTNKKLETFYKNYIAFLKKIDFDFYLNPNLKIVQ